MAVHADSTPACVISSPINGLDYLSQARTKFRSCLVYLYGYLVTDCFLINDPEKKVRTVPLPGETGFPITYSFYDVFSKIFLVRLLFKTGLKTGFVTNVSIRIGRLNELIRRLI